MLAIKAHPFRNDMAAKRIVKKAKLKSDLSRVFSP